MLTYSFEGKQSESMYEYLYRCIREDILRGVLKAHGKLPSKRSFAKNLGVSNTTVENAYAQLVTEGYLYTLPKRGFFVSALEPRLETPPPGKADIVFEEQEPTYFADFVSDSVATEPFPFSVWLRLMRHVMSTEPEEVLLTNRPAAGLLPLRQAIAEHLHQFRRMQVVPEQIVVGAGAEYLYGVLIQLLGRDCIYALEDPGSVRLSRIYESNGATLCHIPMDGAGVEPEALEQAGGEILHITPSHHFPTGVVMPVSRRYELLDWAAQKPGRYIIEDDYDCEFRLSGRPIPTLQSIDGQEKVIYINTFSQSLAPAFRIGYLVLPPQLAKRFHEKFGFYSGTVSCLEQLTLARFLSQGYFERHLGRMRSHYRDLRNRLLEALEQSALGPYMKIREENSGVHFLMELRTDHTDEELVEAGKKQGLHLSFVSQYCKDRALRQEHVLVLNYSGLLPQRVEEAVARLCRCVLGTEESKGST